MNNCDHIECEQVSASECIEKRISNNVKKYCKNGHEIILANGPIRSAYFRHKNSVYTCEWHLKWQSLFTETEVTFDNELQLKKRRADAIFEDNIVLEFQHSYIEADEVNARTCDYSVNNYKVIWILDGSNHVKMSKINDKYRLDFTGGTWRYKSFLSNEVIFVDIDIFEILPKYVKGDMIDVCSFMDKDEFILTLSEHRT